MLVGRVEVSVADGLRAARRGRRLSRPAAVQLLRSLWTSTGTCAVSVAGGTGWRARTCNYCSWSCCTQMWRDSLWPDERATQERRQLWLLATERGTPGRAHCTALLLLSLPLWLQLLLYRLGGYAGHRLWAELRQLLRRLLLGARLALRARAHNQWRRLRLAAVLRALCAREAGDATSCCCVGRRLSWI